MKKTMKGANGTSFHGVVINATIQDLRKILGEPTASNNDGTDKVNFEWEMETESGDVFTVYDWKEYRSLLEDEVIEWHIGGHSKEVTVKAQGELAEAFSDVA